MVVLKATREGVSCTHTRGLACYSAVCSRDGEVGPKFKISRLGTRRDGSVVERAD